MDIKYGIERLFAADVIPGGPSLLLHRTSLQHPKNYAGPYKGGDLPTSSITTTPTSITVQPDEARTPTSTT